MTDLKQKILAAVQDDLSAIETALGDHLKPHFELVREVAGHLLFAGGKRLRPLLMLLAARLCGRTARDNVHYAIIFEYLHAASLLHDDVVDGGTLRRGRTAAHKAWDPPTAVLTGDFLMARALSLAARAELPAIITVIAGITEFMSQGEIRQLTLKGDVTLSEKDYFEVIRCKTAVLFQGACHVGALLAGGPPPHIQALKDYGLHLGMAFQMADDLLDYTQDTRTLGKGAGTDLLEGKLTLPVIHTLDKASPRDRLWIEAMIRARTFSATELRRLLDLLEDYGGIAYTRECAANHMEQAKKSLAAFGPSPDREVLLDIVDFAWSRTA